MSVYRCAICDEYKDADIHGCNEHPTDECECICDDCCLDPLDHEEFLDLEDQLELLLNE